MRKVVGFLVGFIVSLLATIAVSLKFNLVVTGPLWLLVWGAAGACGSWICVRLVPPRGRVPRRHDGAPEHP